MSFFAEIFGCLIFIKYIRRVNYVILCWSRLPLVAGPSVAISHWKMKKICFVNAIKGTAESFLAPHFQNLCQKYEVHYVSCDVREGEDPSFPGVISHRVDIRRPISLMADLKAVWQLYKVMRREKFDAVHSVTPKAGLVCALAAKMAGIKHRSHTITGQVWATKTGLMRKLLRAMDHIIVALDNHLFTDAESQRQYLIGEGILTEQGSRVLANGSLRGADLSRFNPEEEVRAQYRAEIGAADKHFVFAFLGRLNVDKGVRELLAAFDRLAGDYAGEKTPFLMLVGRDEEDMVSCFSRHKRLQEGKNFCFYGSTPSPERVMQAADCFVLPTYREGFPQSPLECGALALPIIISDIYGTRDSIIDEVTGIRCQPQDVGSLYEAMKRMISDPVAAREMGKRGRKYVEEKYAQPILEEAWMELYDELLS